MVAKASSMAADDRRSAVDRIFLVRMLLDVVFDLVTRDALRIEAAAGMKWIAADERPIFVEQIVAAAVDEEVLAQCLVARAACRCELLVQRETIGIVLAPEDVLDVVVRFDQLLDHLLLARAQPLRVEGHFRRPETSNSLLDVGRDVPDCDGLRIAGCIAAASALWVGGEDYGSKKEEAKKTHRHHWIDCNALLLSIHRLGKRTKWMIRPWAPGSRKRSAAMSHPDS
jgi:hypothetical protein